MLVVATQAPARSKHQSATQTFTTDVLIAGGIFPSPQQDTQCMISARAWSGSFFDGLVRVEDASGVRFYKDKKPALYFPEKLALRLSVLPTDADGESPSYLMEDPVLDQDCTQSLHFTVATRNKTQTTRAQILYHRVYEAILWGAQRDKWNIDLEVDLEKVPLTDAIVITIFSGNGEKFARLAGAVGAPGITPPSQQPNQEHSRRERRKARQK